MRKGAIQISCANPQLQSFSIAFLPSTLAIRSGHSAPQAFERGEYEVVKDAQGEPVTLLARERSERWWIALLRPWNHASNTKQGMRRRAYELRPHTGPDLVKGGIVERFTYICVLLLIVAIAYEIRDMWLE